MLDVLRLVQRVRVLLIDERLDQLGAFAADLRGREREQDAEHRHGDADRHRQAVATVSAVCDVVSVFETLRSVTHAPQYIARTTSSAWLYGPARRIFLGISRPL